ncbi:hypothetical protein BH23PLA1_BH23PLA1_25000 [soil metagenome]
MYAEESDLELVPLVLLRAGQTASVGEVLGGGDVVHRLQEMGLRLGAAVEMVRPGSPCIIRLEGQKLCVRSEEMAGVLVRLGVATPW